MTIHEPAALRDVALTHHLIQTNGVNLHVVEAGDPDGETIVLLHGFPEFWYGWRMQIPTLARAGYRVLVPDQRGYNLSEKPQTVDQFLVTTLAADIIGILDHFGIADAYLVGHDWGAGVAWQIALTYPDRLKKLVILNVPHPTVFSGVVRSDVRQALKSWYIGFFQIPLLPEVFLALGDSMLAAQALLNSSREGTFSDADIQHYTAAWRQPGALTAMLNWYRALVQYPPRIFQGEEARIRVPTLIIWGAKDAFLEREMATASRDLCDQGRLVVFENATHWVQHEEAHGVNALMLEYLRPDAPSAANGANGSDGASRSNGAEGADGV